MKKILLFIYASLFLMELHAQVPSSTPIVDIQTSTVEPVIINVISKPSRSGKIHLLMSTIVEREVIIEVYDMAEDKVRSQSQKLQEGDNFSSIDIQSLEPGHYRISVVCEEEIYSKAFVKLWK